MMSFEAVGHVFISIMIGSVSGRVDGDFVGFLDRGSVFVTMKF